ncbi:MAG: AraC family transcriptional regulator [Nitritalea sp.]
MVILKKELSHELPLKDYVLWRFDKEHQCAYAMLHFHDFWEIVYAPSGSGIFVVEGFSQHFTSGVCVLIPPGKLHKVSYQVEKPSLEYVLHLQADFIDRLCGLGQTTSHLQQFIQRANSGIYFEYRDEGKITALFQALNEDPDTEQLPHLIRLLLFLAYAEPYQVLEINSRAQDSLDFQRKRFQKVLEIVEQRFQENLSTQQVAEEVAMTPTSFCRFFKAFTNKSFKVFLQGYRIQEAKRFLLHTDFSLTEVAFRSGFTSLSYFDRTFKKQEGLSPGRFRKMYQF